jgi:hypothetical protein
MRYILKYDEYYILGLPCDEFLNQQGILCIMSVYLDASSQFIGHTSYCIVSMSVC